MTCAERVPLRFILRAPTFSSEASCSTKNDRMSSDGLPRVLLSAGRMKRYVPFVWQLTHFFCFDQAIAP